MLFNTQLWLLYAQVYSSWFIRVTACLLTLFSLSATLDELVVLKTCSAALGNLGPASGEVSVWACVQLCVNTQTLFVFIIKGIPVSVQDSNLRFILLTGQSNAKIMQQVTNYLITPWRK